MVEQTAAAAAALESQAQALRRAVAVFQIAEGVGGAAGLSRRRAAPGIRRHSARSPATGSHADLVLDVRGGRRDVLRADALA